jgi:hypothetical protein
MSESKMRNAKPNAVKVNWLDGVAKVIRALAQLLRVLHDTDLL